MASINEERANLLANLCGWLIKEHSATFSSVIVHAADEDSGTAKDFYDTDIGLAVLVSCGIILTALISSALYIKFSRGGSKPAGKSVVDGDQEMTSTVNPVLPEQAAESA